MKSEKSIRSFINGIPYNKKDVAQVVRDAILELVRNGASLEGWNMEKIGMIVARENGWRKIARQLFKDEPNIFFSGMLNNKDENRMIDLVIDFLLMNPTLNSDDTFCVTDHDARTSHAVQYDPNIGKISRLVEVDYDKNLEMVSTFNSFDWDLD